MLIRISILSSFLLAAGPSLARAQGYGGSASYLPSGGGFVPYRMGPALATAPAPAMPFGMRQDLGGLRTTVALLRPIGAGAMPMVTGGRGLLPLRPGGGMNAMPRPPVGSYPFRIPPSLVGPGSAPMMGM